MKCNKRQTADVFGVSEETLTQWAKQGCPVEVQRKGAQGNVYDTAEVFRWRLERLEQGESVLDLAAERARHAKAQADKIELELSETRGELIRVEDVMRTWAGIASTIKSAMLGLPAKLAGQVSGPGKRAQVEAILRLEIKNALTELATDGRPRKGGDSQAQLHADDDASPGSDGKPVGGPA